MRKLILFCTVGPDRPQQAVAPFRFARAAVREGLPVEVRLAGDAVLLARRDVFEGLAPDSPLRQFMEEVLAAGATVSL